MTGKTARICAFLSILTALTALFLFPSPARAEAETATERQAGAKAAAEVQAQADPSALPLSRSLSPADALLLSDTLADRCPDVPYAARVGMAAAVLGRLNSPLYPDSLPDVLAQLEAEGAFGRPSPDPSDLPVRLQLRRFFAGISGLTGLAGLTGEAPVPAGRIRELSRDAVRAAADGADPAGGALTFRYVPPSRAGDLLFDDSREDGFREKLESELAGFPTVIGTVGFR